MKEGGFGHPYQAEREALEEKRIEWARIRVEEYLRNGPHPWDWSQKKALDEFEDRWGYRPVDKVGHDLK